MDNETPTILSILRQRQARDAVSSLVYLASQAHVAHTMLMSGEVELVVLVTEGIAVKSGYGLVRETVGAENLLSVNEFEHDEFLAGPCDDCYTSDIEHTHAPACDGEAHNITRNWPEVWYGWLIMDGGDILCDNCVYYIDVRDIPCDY